MEGVDSPICAAPIRDVLEDGATPSQCSYSEDTAQVSRMRPLTEVVEGGLAEVQVQSVNGAREIRAPQVTGFPGTPDDDDFPQGFEMHGEEVELDNDALLLQWTHRELHENPTAKDREASAAVASAAVASLAVGNLPDHEEVFRRLEAALAERFGSREIYLKVLLDKVMPMAETRAFVDQLWDFYVEALKTAQIEKSYNKKAWAFTSKRFSTWPGRQRAWVSNESIMSEARKLFGHERSVRYLSLTINYAEEELYEIFVRAQKSANIMSLSYPSETYNLTDAKRKALYFIAGWMLSRIMTHVKRHKIRQVEWCDIVNTNVFRSKDQAIVEEPELHDLVREVDARNDTENGRGVLFPRMRFFEFVLALEMGYFHNLRNPVVLGAFLGDFQTEVLEVVRNSLPVKTAWEACCPTGKDSLTPAVRDEVLSFLLGKWHKCRMGDYARRLSEVSATLGAAKADNLALRTTLKAVSKDGRGREASAARRGSLITDAHHRYRQSLSGMSDGQLHALQKPALVSHIRAAGGKCRQSTKKAGLRLQLRSLVPGLGPSEDSTGRGGVFADAVVPTESDDSEDDEEVNVGGESAQDLDNEPSIAEGIEGLLAAGVAGYGMYEPHDEDDIDVGLGVERQEDDTYDQYYDEYVNGAAEFFSV